MMEKMSDRASGLFGGLATFMRKCLFKVISVGPVPDHIAFIMDGNRRFAKKKNNPTGTGHKAGYSSLMSMLAHCYELGVKYATVYAFSIDNFKRPPEEVEFLMDLMLEKIEGLLEKESIVIEYGIRVYFIGNLELLCEPVRLAAQRAMKATAKNTKFVLLVCVAYTSCDEILHAVQESCKHKRNEIQANGEIHGGVDDDEKTNGVVLRDAEEAEVSEKKDKLPSIKLVDIEKHLYMAVAPDPDIVIRSSGETRLSNFLLWQTSHCPLYSPSALWPELGLGHLVWTVLNFQRSYQYLEKKRKKI